MNRHTPQLNQASTSPQFWRSTLALCLVVGIAGCQPSDTVQTTYGQRKGWGETSLNGTKVLSNMFEAAGHRVRSWQYLSPSLEKADVIVWAPDDFEPPSWEVQDWLYYWATDTRPGGAPRVLIYVGRDYDASVDYWTKMQSQAPPGLGAEYKRRLAEAKNDVARNRPNTLAPQEKGGWFSLDDAQKPSQVKQLAGPWAEGIDSSATEIHRHTQLSPSFDDNEVLLSNEQGDALVSQINLDGYRNVYGRVILVENGSWLLNAPLVNREHRKLAGKLVDSIGPPERSVVFLESDAGGPPITDEDPNATPPTGLQMFLVWPIGAVLTQLAALGIIVAAMKWPIFGVPRRLRERSATDFASHIAAVGRLLGQGTNRNHAINLLRVYWQSLHREASAPAPSPTVSAELPGQPPSTTATQPNPTAEA